MDAISSIHDENGRRQLDVIDRLRILTREEHDIEIPQIVVVGQQSSGKSSVLRALSKIPFPTDDDLCTRFATEIVCRHSLETSFKATIIPASAQPDPGRQAEFDAFSAAHTQVETEQDIADVINEVRTILGLQTGNVWSKDKLKLEFSGPAQDHLTLIDLPGLISVDGTDKTFVDQLVASHLGGSQTIILAVVYGPLDSLSQRTFDLLGKYKQRTIGVITAPDLITWSTTRGGAVRDIAQNKIHNLGYKWHMLRNLSSRELEQGLDRDVLESDYFNESRQTIPWLHNGDILLGVVPLRKTLGNLLQTRIQAHLPEIQRRLDGRLKECKADLELLGRERCTPEQQRDFLTKCTNRLQAVIYNDLQGRPGLAELEFDGLSLRDSIRNANEDFAVYMENNGHTWQPAGAEDPVESLSTPSDTKGIIQDEPHKVLITDIRQYIGEEIYRKPGLNLRGIPDPSWIAVFFLEQSRKWESIVLKHGDTVCEIVENYLREFVYNCADIDTADRLLESILIPDMSQRRKALHEKLTEVLTPYKSKRPATLSRGYLERVAEMEAAYAAGAVGHESVTQKNGSLVLHCMREYYLVAKDVLLDNVESLAIENVLLKDLHETLTTITVFNMSDQQLSDIAGEHPEVTDKRKALMARVRDLEEARTLLSACMLQRLSLESARSKSSAISHFSTPPATPSGSTQPARSQAPAASSLATHAARSQPSAASFGFTQSATSSSSSQSSRPQPSATSSSSTRPVQSQASAAAAPFSSDRPRSTLHDAVDETKGRTKPETHGTSSLFQVPEDSDPEAENSSSFTSDSTFSTSAPTKTSGKNVVRTTTTAFGSFGAS